MKLTKNEIIDEGWELSTWINDHYRFVRPEANILEDQYYIEMSITLSGRWNCAVKEISEGVRIEEVVLFDGTIHTVEDLRLMYKLIDVHSEFKAKDPNREIKSWRDK